MASTRVAVVLAVVLLLGGCSELFTTGNGDGARTQTAAPVPTTAAGTTQTGVQQPNTTGYRALRPTCSRPPEVVIYIQVAALANNDPATDEGINTTWQFTAPSRQAYTGPYENYVDSIESFYSPLLEADQVSYGPMVRADGVAHRRLTVRSDGHSTTYNWTVERQSAPPVEGCWLTTGIAELPVDATVAG